MDDYLVGVRLRPTAQADDYRVGDLELHVGDLVLVESGSAPVMGEVRRPKREIPEMKKRRAQPGARDEGGRRRDAPGGAPGDRVLQRRGAHRFPRPGA